MMIKTIKYYYIYSYKFLINLKSYLLIQGYLRFQQINSLTFDIKAVTLYKKKFTTIAYIVLFPDPFVFEFSYVQTEWDSFVVTPALVLKILLLTFFISTFLLLVDGRAISPILQKTLPDSIVGIKVVEFLVLVVFVMCISHHDLHMTIDKTPVSFLSLETLVWLKEWISSDLLFTTIMLIWIKNMLFTSFRLFACFINPYIYSKYIKFFIWVFFQLIFFSITFLTMGSVFGVMFKLYYSYIGNVPSTGVLFTVFGSIIIWRKLLQDEIMLLINTEITNYVNKSSYNKDIINSELIPYLKGQVLTHWDEFDKIFSKEGYAGGLSFIKEQIVFFDSQFIPISQNTTTVVASIEPTLTPWGKYILGGVAVAVILLIAGYGIYNYWYTSNKKGGSSSSFSQNQRTLPRDESVPPISPKHTEIGESISKSKGPNLAIIKSNQEKFDNIWYPAFLNLWRKNDFNYDRTLKYIETLSPIKAKNFTRFLNCASTLVDVQFRKEQSLFNVNTSKAVVEKRLGETICGCENNRYSHIFANAVLGPEHIHMLKFIKNDSPKPIMQSGHDEKAPTSSSSENRPVLTNELASPLPSNFTLPILTPSKSKPSNLRDLLD